MSEERARWPVYALRLVPLRGGGTIHGLRAVLKRLLRQHHFRCIGLREERADHVEDADEHC